MTKLAEQLLAQAKTLNDEEREELAACLMGTLEPSTDPQYLAEWEAEINRRIEEIDSGKTKLIPADQALRQIRNSGRRNEKAR